MISLLYNTAARINQEMGSKNHLGFPEITLHGCIDCRGVIQDMKLRPALVQMSTKRVLIEVHGGGHEIFCSRHTQIAAREVAKTHRGMAEKAECDTRRGA